MVLVEDSASITHNLIMNKSYLEKLAKRIKSLRLEKGLTQDDLAVDGISRSMISLVEIAKTDITVSKLKIIADSLGLKVKDLFNKEIIFFDFLITTIKNESKVVVKFAFVDNPDDFHIFITRSDVMKDRLERDKDVMPFIATIKQIKNYTAYE